MAAMWNSSDRPDISRETARVLPARQRRQEPRPFRLNAALPKFRPSEPPPRAYSVRRVFSLALASE